MSEISSARDDDFCLGPAILLDGFVSAFAMRSENCAKIATTTRPRYV
jgi:hypothetical protein